MDSLFENFSIAEEASASLVALSLVEPILILVAFVFLITVTIKHYLKTKSLGALLIILSLVGSIFISILVSFLENQVSSNTDLKIVLIGNVILGSLFLVFVYGFRLICKQAECK